MTVSIRELLSAEVRAQSARRTVALLLSGGLDSFVTGFVCHEVGKDVVLIPTNSTASLRRNDRSRRRSRATWAGRFGL